MAIQRICSIEGCGKPVRARGWCATHHQHWRLNGDPLLYKRAQNGRPLQFVENAVRSTETECIEWPYHIAGGGYGYLRFQKRKRGAHVVVCELVHGPQPSHGHEVAHSCGNKKCCNPAHLRWATRSENHADKVAHGTSVRGERNGVARLTESQVREIKALQGKVSQNKLAKRFGVGTSTIRNIREGKTWAWLE